MPSLSAPGREKDQRGGEKVAAEEKPRDMSLEDAAVERLYGWLSNLEAALVNERKTSAEVRRWPQKTTGEPRTRWKSNALFISTRKRERPARIEK